MTGSFKVFKLLQDRGDVILNDRHGRGMGDLRKKYSEIARTAILSAPFSIPVISVFLTTAMLVPYVENSVLTNRT